MLDVNFGCPSKQVCTNSGGSALLREPVLARKIVAAVRAAVTIPFTVKMRSGWDHELKSAPDIAWMCQEEGVEAVTVHWRTRADLYGGVRELDTLAEVVRRLSIPVIANGDVVDGKSALQTLEYTKAAGVMVGRGAVRNPWVFREIEAAFAGLPAPVIDHAERERVMIAYFESVRDQFDRGSSARAASAADLKTLNRIKKLAKYFADGISGGEELRRGIWHSETLEGALQSTRDYFQWAREQQPAA